MDPFVFAAVLFAAACHPLLPTLCALLTGSCLAAAPAYRACSARRAHALCVLQGKAAALAEATQRLEELKARQEELEREKRVRAVLRSPP